VSALLLITGTLVVPVGGLLFIMSLDGLLVLPELAGGSPGIEFVAFD